MSSSSRWAAAAAVALFFILPARAQQVAAPQEAARCGGLFCDMYYAHNPAVQAPGQPAPAPGQPGSVFLPCHDFVCGMFGGRTVDQPVAVAAEPAPVEPTAKPKRKRVARHIAGDAAKDDAKARATAVEAAAR